MAALSCAFLEPLCPMHSCVSRDNTVLTTQDLREHVPQPRGKQPQRRASFPVPPSKEVAGRGEVITLGTQVAKPGSIPLCHAVP